MANALRNNLTSGYLDAAAFLSPKKQRRRIVAYVESYDDVAFWRNLLSEYENDQYYFTVMLPSSTSLAKGKKIVLMNLMKAEQLGQSLICCVDSDYDFLLQGRTPVSKTILNSPYILQTYAYAIENYLCCAESLHEVCVQATLNDRPIFDFPKFFRRYSQIIYPLFLWHLYFYRQLDTNSFPIYEFGDCTALHQSDINNMAAVYNSLEHHVQVKLNRLEAKYPVLRSKVKQLGEELTGLGLLPETTYLYVQGHHLHDNVVMKLLVPICTQLRRERETEIRRLAVHEKQFQNEMTSYEHSQASVELMLKKNVSYTELYTYQWMKKDVEDFMKLLTPLPKGSSENQQYGKDFQTSK